MCGSMCGLPRVPTSGSLSSHYTSHLRDLPSNPAMASTLNDDDCVCYYKKWLGTLDWGSMHSDLIFQIWDYQWFAFTSFAFLCRKKKICERQKAASPRSHLPAYTYKCVFCTHIRKHICRDLVHLDFSGPQGVSSRPLGSHLSTSYVQCVWCVRMHTPTLTYTPTRVENREVTDNTSISPAVKNNPLRQATSALIH